MAISFNRTLWEKLQRCAPTFCEYDDYNWDWSLLQVSYTCLQAQLDVLYAKAPRIFHIGDCGVHHKRKTCDPNKAAQAIEKGIKQYNSLLFPDVLTVELRRGKKMRLKKGNGGWGDVRDKKLCLSFVDSP
jgi:alpha-1,6-mannosyl-glycoprotein beta-1,2-N-acetylglucosaminyltransferase